MVVTVEVEAVEVEQSDSMDETRLLVLGNDILLFFDFLSSTCPSFQIGRKKREDRSDGEMNHTPRCRTVSVCASVGEISCNLCVL